MEKNNGKKTIGRILLTVLGYAVYRALFSNSEIESPIAQLLPKSREELEELILKLDRDIESLQYFIQKSQDKSGSLSSEQAIKLYSLIDLRKQAKKSLSRL